MTLQASAPSPAALPAVTAGGESRPRYQALADDLCERLARTLPPGPVPEMWEIARTYRIPVFTAQFVRRAATTRLRPPVRPPVVQPPKPPGPAWRRIADDLRTRISIGELQGKLPLRSHLAAEYGVCIATVNKAAQYLVDEGLLGVAGNQGTYTRPQLAHAEETPR